MSWASTQGQVPTQVHVCSQEKTVCYGACICDSGNKKSPDVSDNKSWDGKEPKVSIYGSVQ